jgi:DNA-binding NtrC family response regulator
MADLRSSRETKSSRNCPDYIVGQSQAIGRILDLVHRVAARDATVLITGESGTGKELIARALHDLSNRKDKPFVAINCGAIPDNLLEDELFGHVKGAYTDARQSRVGKFEEADGGTLFLDEIGEMPLSLQVKLLRIIEEKTVQRLGCNQNVQVDFRLLAATNADLRQRISEGAFRQDLYYRLNVIPVEVPPLRQRKDDLPLLVHRFLNDLSSRYNEEPKQFDPAAMKRLHVYDWPGNVRELRNVVEMGFVLASDSTQIAADDLNLPDLEISASRQQALFDSSIELPEEGIDLNQAVSELERRLITQSLERTNGNKGKAAALLYLKRTTLVEKLRRMNLLDAFSKAS